jgi:hypothetical protein
MTTARRGAQRRGRAVGATLIGIVLFVAAVAEPAAAAPPPTRLSFSTGEIVPIPASIPHEDGDMVDRRIIPNLRWIAQRYPIYITDGFSGRLPNGEHAGCHGCHVKNSDHHNGLAVDIVPLSGSSSCDRAWRGITRLARWAEPRQNRPLAPFRWVGYEGDAHHGCGDHLHLSWSHATAPSSEVAEWVEVFAVSFQGVARTPVPQRRPIPPKAAPRVPPAPPGGVSSVRAGGISPRGD